MLAQIWVWQNHLEVILSLWDSIRTLGFRMGCHWRVRNGGATSSVFFFFFFMVSLQIVKMFCGGLDGSFMTLRNSAQPNVPFIVNCVPRVSSSL